MLRKKLGSMAIMSLIATAMFVSVALAAGYTIGVDTQNSSVANVFVGQSFTTVGAGRITQIDLASQFASTGVFTIYQGVGVGGAVLYSQPVTLPSGTGAYNNAIILSTPVPVSAGASYTFIIGADSGNTTMYYNDNNPYSGGFAYYGLTLIGVSPNVADDLKFKVYIEANSGAVGGVAERISLTPMQAGQVWFKEWGLVALSGLMLLGGAVLWRVRK